MRGPVAFAVALILAFTFVLFVAADDDCADFSTQGEAQRYFQAGGGSAGHNFLRLDEDGDGFVCESLPSDSGGSARSSYEDTEADSHAEPEMFSGDDADRYKGSGDFSSPSPLPEPLVTPVGLGILVVLGVISRVSWGRSEH